MKKRITLEQYKSAKNNRNVIWIGTEFPKNTKTKTTWKCQMGHVWMPTYNEVIIKNSGCPYCYGHKTIDDYQNLKRDNVKWIGIELPKNVKTKTTWHCSHGHTWQDTWDNVCRIKKNCPYCPPKSRKTKEEYITGAESAGIKWIGKVVPKDIDTKTEWMCPDGHIFSKSYESVITHHVRCPFCPKSFAKTIDDYRRIIGKDGAYWIGKELPKNVTYHTEWKCNMGHIWFTSYKSIVLQGSGCPVCQQSQGEFAIQKVLNNLDISYVRQKTFSECRKIYVLPFDFYFKIDSREFLIEYDGLHHYQPIKFFGGEKGFQERLTNDSIKTKFAQDNGFILIRIPYTKFDSIETFIKTEINCP